MSENQLFVIKYLACVFTVWYIVVLFKYGFDTKALLLALCAYISLFIGFHSDKQSKKQMAELIKKSEEQNE